MGFFSSNSGVNRGERSTLCAGIYRALPYLVAVLVLRLISVYTFRNPSATLFHPIDEYATYQETNTGVNKALWRTCEELPRAMSRPERDSTLRLIGELSGLFERSNITFCITWGTLIGSFMFHDLIPWDDDVDIMVEYEDLPKVKRLFANATVWETYGIHTFKNKAGALGEKEYSLATLQAFPKNAPDTLYYRVHPDVATGEDKSIHKFKFYRREGALAGTNPWRWPFIDVTYYKEDTNGLLMNIPPPNARPNARYPRDTVYPLVKRPLGNIWVPAPRDPAFMLRERYGNFKCSTQDYTHRHESWIWWWNRYSVDCALVSRCYPRVVPGPTLNGQDSELLVLDGTVIQEIKLQSNGVKSERPSDF